MRGVLDAKQSQETPMNTTHIQRLGPVAQIAYVVPNLQDAIRHWARTLGIGPWLVIPHIEYRVHEYEGRPTRADISIALAYSGELQIELIEQHNDEPSVYRRTGNGMHHTAVLTSAPEEDERRLVAAGMHRLQRGISAAGVETVFLAGGEVFPGMFELIRATPPLQSAFQWLRGCAAAWDGQTETVQLAPPPPTSGTR
jgi:hypothetical protein